MLIFRPYRSNCAEHSGKYMESTRATAACFGTWLHKYKAASVQKHKFSQISKRHGGSAPNPRNLIDIANQPPSSSKRRQPTCWRLDLLFDNRARTNIVTVD